MLVNELTINLRSL